MLLYIIAAEVLANFMNATKTVFLTQVILRWQKNADVEAIQSTSRRQKYKSSRQFSKNCIFLNIQLKGVENTLPPFKNLVIDPKIQSKKY